MATGIDPTIRLRSDLFTKHIDNIYSEPAIKWHSIYLILSLSIYQIYESIKIKDRMEDELNGKSMGDIGQIYSEAPRPDYQQVLEDDTCMRWIFFSSIDRLDGKSMGDVG